MEDIRSVRKYLEEIYCQIKEELRGERFIYELVGSPEKLDLLMEKQRELIFEYIEDWESSAKDFSKRFEALYTSIDVPYTVVAWNIDKIRSKIIEKLLEENYSNKFVVKMSKYMDDLVNQIAKIYIKKDIEELSKIGRSAFQEKILFKAHQDYINRIVRAVKEDDMSRFPVMSWEECEFSEYLSYPESLMVCMDANMCSYIHKLHGLIHDTANTFFAFYNKGMYYQAYKSLKDTLELAAKLSKTISELYLLTYADVESHFFKFVEGMSKQGGYKYVSMIDIANLKKINTNYGEKAGDLVIKEVERRLNEFFGKDRENSLLISGNTSDFFLFTMNSEEEKMRTTIGELERLLSFNIQVNGKSVDVSTLIATLELEPYVELVQEDIRDILFYLKEEAKKEKLSSNISIGSEKRREILGWIHEKYKNVEIIKSKLKEGDIEIVFHPIVSTGNTKDTVGAEVLVRLRDGKKLIPAGIFIDMIYELNLIDRLDSLVLEKLREYKDLIRKGIRRLFINVSPKSLMSDTYVENLCSFLKEFSDFEIILELTEQELLNNVEVIERVATRGHVAIAVDDFGAGYSSLRLVGSLAEREMLRVLKIDGSLIKEVLSSKNIEKIVYVISVLTRKLNIEAVAEFIESPEELKLMEAFGIDYAQGYYIASPMTLPELLLFVKGGHKEGMATG
jgi:EAL domain-containing protein (putative c-di-GMP-specific phosphodiesterase class I)/GGDEF domain-containing protein